MSLADVVDRQGDYEAAKGYYEQAMEAVGDRGDVWAAAYALGSYGQSAARHDDHELAGERYQQALDDLPPDRRRAWRGTDHVGAGGAGLCPGR